MKVLRKIKLIVAGALLTGLASMSVAVIGSDDVLIVCSGDCEKSRAMISGFSASLEKQNKNIDVSELVLSNDESANSKLFAQAKSPGLIFAVDYGAAKKVSAVSKNVPIVVGVARSQSELKAIPNATGVVVQYPVKTQLDWIKRILPQARRVGVIYSTEENHRWVSEAQVTAQKMGLELIAVRAKTAKDLPYALKDVLSRVDVLLGVPDSIILSRQTAKAVLLASFRKRIPFVGLSSSWVKAGALYSLDWDAENIGQQNARMGSKVLGGSSIASLGVQNPQKIELNINIKTAEYCKLDLSDQLIADAKQVFN